MGTREQDIDPGALFGIRPVVFDLLSGAENWIFSTTVTTPRTILNAGFGVAPAASRVLPFPVTPCATLNATGTSGTRRLIMRATYKKFASEEVFTEDFDTKNQTTISTKYRLPMRHVAGHIISLDIVAGCLLVGTDTLEFGLGWDQTNASPNFGLMQQIYFGLPFRTKPRRNERRVVAIVSSTNANPIVLTVPSGHGVNLGDKITVQSHLVNTNANGDWIAGAVTATTITLRERGFPYTTVPGNGVGLATGDVIIARGGLVDEGDLLLSGTRLSYGIAAQGEFAGDIRFDEGENAFCWIANGPGPTGTPAHTNLKMLWIPRK